MLSYFNHVNRNLDGFRWRRGRFCGCGHWCDGYRCNELVTPPGNGFNEPWILRIVVDGSAKFFEDDVQAAIKVDVCPLRPQFLTSSSRLTISPGRSSNTRSTRKGWS